MYRQNEMPSPAELVVKAETIMCAKANTPHKRTFALAVLAGVFIGLGFVYCAAVLASGTAKIVGGLVFSLGLSMVLIIGADLFTSSTLTAIPAFSKKVPWGRVVQNWVVVYFGNFAGALFLMLLILLSGHLKSGNGSVGALYLSMAEAKLSYTFIEAFTLGVLCNLMVCLGVWMSYAGSTVLEKMGACMLPVSLFVVCGFEHSVANMFMVPTSIVYSQITPEAVLEKLSFSPEYLRNTLTWGNFFVKNLLPVTLGNLVGGGLLVGFVQWRLHMRPKMIVSQEKTQETLKPKTLSSKPM